MEVFQQTISAVLCLKTVSHLHQGATAGVPTKLTAPSCWTLSRPYPPPLLSLEERTVSFMSRCCPAVSLNPVISLPAVDDTLKIPEVHHGHLMLSMSSFMSWRGSPDAPLTGLEQIIYGPPRSDSFTGSCGFRFGPFRLRLPRGNRKGHFLTAHNSLNSNHRVHCVFLLNPTVLFLLFSCH